MRHAPRNRRNQNSRPVAMAAIVEAVEPRTLLSAVSGLSAAGFSGTATPTAVSATKEITVEATYLANTGGHSLKIEEIRLVGDEIRVFSSFTLPRPDSVVSLALQMHRESRTVTVPNRELTVTYEFTNVDAAKTDLYFLRKSGTSSLLYRNPLADTSSGWPIVDVDSGPGSDVELDFTAKPAAPSGLAARVGKEITAGTIPSREVTLYFDEQTSGSAISVNRFVNRYEVRFHALNGTAYSADELSLSRLTFDDYELSETHFPKVVLMDTAAIRLTGPGNTARTFHGRMQTILTLGSHAFQVRVQKVPVFLDEATGSNAFPSPWSDWSDPQTFTVLPADQQILMRPVGVRPNTGETSIGWSIVEDAASYEVMIEKDGQPVLSRAGLNGTYFQLDKFLGTGEFTVRARAVRTDGTTTGWSQPVTFTAIRPALQFSNMPDESFLPLVTSHDSTPTLRWSANSLATHYQISFIDLDKEDAASTMRFASDQDRLNFITTYTQTLPGTSFEHTVALPLVPGKYRVELKMHLGENESVSTSGHMNLLAGEAGVAFLAPGSTNTIQWHADHEHSKHEIWVAYLGPVPGQTVVSGQPGNWRFAQVDNLSSTYRFADDAPGGKYRIWVRPRAYQSPYGDNPFFTTHVYIPPYIQQAQDGPWGPSSDIVLQDPLLRSASPVVHGGNGKLTWNRIPGAQDYEVVVWMHNPAADEVGRLPSSPLNDRFQTTGTEFQLPFDLMNRYGAFTSGTVWIRPLHGPLQDSTEYSQPSIFQFSWQPGFTKQDNRIQWSAVPDAVRYEVQISKADSTETLVTTTTGTPTIQLSPDLVPGKYKVSVTAVRRVGGEDTLIPLASYAFEVVFPKPAGLHVSGTVVSWTAVENAPRYGVTVETIGGDMLQKYQPGDWIHSGTTRASRFFFSTESTSFDLATWVLATYRNSASLRFRISVEVSPNSAESIEFTPTNIPAHSVFAPTIETNPQQKPEVPTLTTHPNGVFEILHQELLPGGGARGVIYRTENGTLLDLEHLVRFQLRVTNLQTGTVRIFDDSQISQLTRFNDLREYRLTGLEFLDNKFAIPDLLTGPYRVEARVQFLPVIFQATSSAFQVSPDSTIPESINVAATPWSDWSVPIEHAVLPTGENILPWIKSTQTISTRPTFQWSSNTIDGQFELWVQNRVTKERVIHKTFANVREFKPLTDLPVGQYDWWVRIVGTPGARKGWSPKQSLEIFAPAISSSVVAETVDATPVVSWTASASAQSYRIQFTSTTTGRVVYQATEANNRLSHRVAVALPNDTYTVSIRAVLPNGGSSAPGVVKADGSFNIPRMLIGASPKNVEFKQSADKWNFKWNAVEGATRYQVWMNFTDGVTGRTERILNSDAFDTELTVPYIVPSGGMENGGKFQLWVRAIRNEAGHESVGRWSTPGTMIVAGIQQHLLDTVMSAFATSRETDSVLGI